MEEECVETQEEEESLSHEGASEENYRLAHIKSEPVDDSSEERYGFEFKLERDTDEAESDSMVELPLLVQIKEEPGFGRERQEAASEDEFASDNSTDEICGETRKLSEEVDNSKASTSNAEGFEFSDGHREDFNSKVFSRCCSEDRLRGDFPQNLKDYERVCNKVRDETYGVSSSSKRREDDEKSELEESEEDLMEISGESDCSDILENHAEANEKKDVHEREKQRSPSLNFSSDQSEPKRKGSFECETCNRCFLRNIDLERHRCIYSTGNILECPFCEKTYMHEGMLDIHMRVHSGEKPFSCPLCPKAFRERSHLCSHMRFHNKGDKGEKILECSVCKKTFTQRSMLDVHMRVHSGEKPFKCPTCSKTFRQRSHLYSHMRIHSGEKPFKCPACEKAFTQRSNLKTHILTHSGERPYKCQECRKAFTKNCDLISHMRTHTGERPFKCQQCGKAFAKSKILISHMYTHSSERPFSCANCGKCFTTSNILSRHRRLVHETPSKPSNSSS